jgi:hypothetical protein
MMSSVINFGFSTMELIISIEWKVIQSGYFDVSVIIPQQLL